MDISVPTPPEATLRIESTDIRHLGEEYDPYGCELHGLDAALLLANIEVGDSSCGGKWTFILARPQCELIRKGYAVKARVAPQQKTEVQVQMLEDAFQQGLERGGGRSSRDSDQDVLRAINAVSAPQKQLRLDQITSWFSRRYSKYVLEGKNARVRAEMELACKTRDENLLMIQSIIVGVIDEIGSEAPASWWQSEPTNLDAGIPQSEDQAMQGTTDSLGADVVGASNQGADVPGASGSVPLAAEAPAGNRRLVIAEQKRAEKAEASSAKRKAVYDIGQEHLMELKNMSGTERVRYVKKLKVEPLKGLLMCLQGREDQIPVGRKADNLATVFSYMQNMALPSTVAEVASQDVEMGGVQSAEVSGAQGDPRDVQADQTRYDTATQIGIEFQMEEDDDEREYHTLSEENQKDLALSFLKQFSIS
eukprot:gene6350-7610_t